MIKKFVLTTILVASTLNLVARTYELTSPDGMNVISVNYDKYGLTYSLAYDGEKQFFSTPVSMCVENKVWGAPGDYLRKVIRTSVDSPIVFPVAKI